MALVARLAALTPQEREEVLRALKAPQRREFNERWRAWAHRGQVPPDGDWLVWLIRAGRGFGKTRAGAEWVNAVANDTPGARIALVSGTKDDVRRVMVEGTSGLLSVAADVARPRWHASAGTLTYANGAEAQAFSAAAPELLRGPEHGIAWCDELGKWRGAAGEAAWDNLLMGMRGGDRPRVLVTTTPRPTRLMRKVMAMPGLVETGGRTHDNPHLPGSFLSMVTAEYGGTRAGRQELDGEMIDDVAGALWTRALIEGARVRRRPKLLRIVVAVDPPAGETGDACGIVAVGIAADGTGYVIEDASVAGASPGAWAAAVAGCAARVRADRVVAEANNGGKMVEAVLRGADRALPVRLVHASKGKVARAEPVAALYEAGRVRHVGTFPALEDELCGLVAGGGYEGPGRSPDRADALVWALTELMLGKQRRAVAVRGL
jgi:phage terminase large subunit-like protein